MYLSDEVRPDDAAPSRGALLLVISPTAMQRTVQRS